MLRTYVVQPGDTLISIAEKFYGEGKAFTDIYRANESIILDPDHLQPGTKLYIPPSAEEVERETHEPEPCIQTENPAPTSDRKAAG
jgi:hypothetical protein